MTHGLKCVNVAMWKFVFRREITQREGSIMKKNSYITNRPYTYTTWDDVKRLWRKHPVKTTLILPVATAALGGQMLLYFVTVPFAMANNFLSSF